MKKSTTPRFAGCVGAALLAGTMMLTGTAALAASDYPSKPIRVVVPYAAGGISDTTARLVSEAMSRHLGQPIIIENRGGGGGRIGTASVARATPDGYELLMTTNGTQTFMAVTEADLAYDPIEDFTPISLISSYGLLMVVHPEVPATTVGEFIDYVRANPGEVCYATSGVGSGLHFAGELFNSLADIDMLHVPYRGSGPATQDVIAGVCQVTFDGGAKPFVDAERLRLLGTTSATRDPRFPDTPTIAEGGLESYDLTYWFALMGPAGIPESIQQRLNDAVVQAMESPELQARMTELGMNIEATSPDELVERTREGIRELSEIAASVPTLQPAN